MDNNNINEILSQLPTISSKRNYWFVRTNGGLYYDDFFKNNFIAIGWDEILLYDANEAHKNKEAGLEVLGNKIALKYKDSYRPNYIASQILKFVYEIKKGDIVLIPSDSSSKITFGEVADGAAYIEEIKTDNESVCPFLKRKKINWIKTVHRDNLSPYLFSLMYSHHTITNGDEYSELIDRVINSFYIKDKDAHLILAIQTTTNIKSKELFNLGSYTLEIFDDFCKEENLEYNSDNLSTKMDLQSPGIIEFSGWIPAVILIGMAFNFIAGGTYSFKQKDTELKYSTKGLIERLRNYLETNTNAKRKKELVEKYIKELEMKNPDELVNAIKAIEGENKDKPKNDNNG